MELGRRVNAADTFDNFVKLVDRPGSFAVQGNLSTIALPAIRINVDAETSKLSIDVTWPMENSQAYRQGGRASSAWLRRGHSVRRGLRDT